MGRPTGQTQTGWEPLRSHLATGVRQLHISRPPTPSNHGESGNIGTFEGHPGHRCPPASLHRPPWEGPRPQADLSPQEEQLLGPTLLQKASARGCFHTEAISASSLLPSIPPPPSPGLLPPPPVTHKDTHSPRPPDTTPTGATHKASALSRATGGNHGGLVLPGPWSARERGFRSKKQRQDWARSGPGCPGWESGSRVGGSLRKAAFRHAPPFASAASPAPYPRFPRAAGPTHRSGRSPPHSTRPARRSQPGRNGCGGRGGYRRGAWWLAELTTLTWAPLGALHQRLPWVPTALGAVDAQVWLQFLEQGGRQHPE